MMFKKSIVIAVAGLITSAAWVSAQDNPKPAQPRPAQPRQAQTPATEETQRNRVEVTGDQSGWHNSDQAMASCVTIHNQEEVALAKMAQEKLQNEEAKKFAAMLAEEHQAYLTKLEKFAPQAARLELERGDQPSQAGNRTGQKRDGVQQASGKVTEERPGIQPTSGTREERTAKSAGGVDMVQIQREIAQECLRAAKAELQEKQGIEADKCFLGNQIAKHGAMKAQLTVFQRHASPELAKVFAEGITTVEKHKNEAEEIMKELSTDSSPRSNDSK